MKKTLSDMTRIDVYSTGRRTDKHSNQINSNYNFKQMKQYFSTFILLAFLGIKVVAQPPTGNFYVLGKVLEEVSNKPLQYVNVVLYNLSDSSLFAGTITNVEGEFELKLNRPGRFYLTADFIGYEKTIVQQIGVKPGNETFNVPDIILQQTTMGIEEVEVVAEKPFVTYKIDRKVIDVSANPSAQGGTAVEALENIPSVQTDLEGNITLRGSSSFTVLIDGRQSALSGTDALRQIPASAIDKIEIITNPSAKYDPDGTAGIINIISKKGKLQGHSLIVNASIGDSPMSSASVNYSYKHKKLEVTTGLNFRDYQSTFTSYNDRTIFNDDYTKNTITNMTGDMEFGSSSATLGLSYHITPSNTVFVNGSFNTFHFGRDMNSLIKEQYIDSLPEYSVSETMFSVYPKSWQIQAGSRQEFNGNREHYLNIDFTYRPSWDDESEDVLAHYSNNSWLELDVKKDENSRGDESGGNIRAELSYQQPFSDKLMMEAGYTLRVDSEWKDYFLYRNPEDNLDLSDKSTFSRTINAGWALLKGDYRGLQYSFGLRAEHTYRLITTEKDNNEYPYDYLGWYPSFATTKEWGNNQVQASYSRRINRPRSYHLNPIPRLDDGNTRFKPNPELEPEYAHALELNYQKSWGRNFIVVESFYKNTQNEMDRVMTLDEDSVLVRTIQNLSSEISTGLELTGMWYITKWWSIMPTASAYYFVVEGEYSGEDRTRDSYNFRGDLVSNFTLPTKTKIQMVGNYRSKSVTIDGERDPMYWVSASIKQEFLDRKLSISYSIRDIFDTRKRKSFSETANAIIYSEMSRKSPTMVLSLSYMFNQNGDNRRGNSQRGGGDDDMNMDF